jgi:protein-S-isoprenylcysteine O-methyltransferase Ste14
MNIVVLITGTLLIILFSWFLSVKHKRYHGIPRFFSFESIFLLFLLNYHSWFKDPFSIVHIISWILLISSAYIAIDGFIVLKKKGKPSGNFENTSVLVKSGLFGVIRHPLYLSLFLFGTGVMLKDVRFQTIIAGAVNLVAIYLTARFEEKEMIQKFGDQYRDYLKETRMFIPFIL